jgi:hypothetical protein
MGITKIGVASWAKINNKVDVFVTNGKEKRTYQVIVELPKADAEEFKAEITACFDAFKKTPAAIEKKIDERFPASLGYEEKDGKTLFKFWTYSEYSATKDKPASPKHIAINVAGKGLLDPAKSIGNGSKIQVDYTLSPYAASKSGFGVSLNMNRVLVRELVEFGGSSDDWSAFGEEFKDEFDVALEPKTTTPATGFTAPISEEEIPF